MASASTETITMTPQPLLTLSLDDPLPLDMSVGAATLRVKLRNPLADTVENLLQLAQRLTERECLVLEREPLGLHVFELEQALRLEGGERFIIQRAGLPGMRHQRPGE